MAGRQAKSREKVVDSHVPDGYAEPGTTQHQILNKPGFGPAYFESRVEYRLKQFNRLKQRYQTHVTRYRPWQYVGDGTQNVWQYVASPLSLHGPVDPPPYSELEEIERQIKWLFDHRDHESWQEVSATDLAMDRFEQKFQKYEEDSKNGREVAGAGAGFAAMIPAVPLIPTAGPLLAGGVAAITSAATHTAIEAEQAAIEGTTLSWRELSAEAAKSGGTAFLSMFVWAKLSSYLMAELPTYFGNRISDAQLLWLGKKLGHVLSRDQFSHALRQFTAEMWANVLSSGAATSFELTFDLLRSKHEMTVGDFASALATNMLTMAGLQVLLAAITHRKMFARPKPSEAKKPAIDEFEEPLRTDVAKLLLLHRVNHPEVAEPVPWHGTQPLEPALEKQSGWAAAVNSSDHALSPREVERIMARVKAYAHDHFPPEQADLIVRDLENWREHPVTSPQIRRTMVDASAFLPEVQGFVDAVKKKAFAFKDHGPWGVEAADRFVATAEAILNKGKMSLAEKEDLFNQYVETIYSIHPFQHRQGHVPDSYGVGWQNYQTPAISFHGHFGEHSNNTAGVLDIHNRGYFAPGPRDDGWTPGDFTSHDLGHTTGLQREFAPSFFAHLAGVDRRIDFAEALSAFQKLLSSRQQELLEVVRFALRWEMEWAPTAQQIWQALHKNAEQTVRISLSVLREQGRLNFPGYQVEHEVEHVVTQLKHFVSAYLEQLPHSNLPSRNLRFHEAMDKYIGRHNFHGGAAYQAIDWLREANSHLSRRTNDSARGPLSSLSPEEILVFLKGASKGEPNLFGGDEMKVINLIRFVEQFIRENPLSGN